MDGATHLSLFLSLVPPFGPLHGFHIKHSLSTYIHQAGLVPGGCWSFLFSFFVVGFVWLW
jgi:hypothetical protein